MDLQTTVVTSSSVLKFTKYISKTDRLVGIVREDLLHYADKFENTRDGNISIENTGCRPDENVYELNPDHTHFIIIRDDSASKVSSGNNWYLQNMYLHM